LRGCRQVFIITRDLYNGVDAQESIGHRDAHLYCTVYIYQCLVDYCTPLYS
jgi:hypothetical protein